MSFISDLLGDIDINKIIEDVPREDVQNTINTYLQSRGIPLDSVDVQNEIERIKKRKELEEQQRKNNRAIGLTIIIALGAISALWYITNKNKK